MTNEKFLNIEGLCAKAGGKKVLNGIDIQIKPSEVHAIMGPNGSGKSTLAHVLMGRPGYEVTSGSISIDGVDVLSLQTWQRAQAGMFIVMQQPIEVPGVKISDLLTEVAVASELDPQESLSLLREEAANLKIDESLLERELNVDLSGGEKKRNETLQLLVSKAKYAILDEIDSGLDVDSLALVAERINRAAKSDQLGVLAITHFNRLLDILEPDQVHVLVDGRIVETGSAELALQLEKDGYQKFLK
ncbi:MAG: Fe-S cluster assembly ATPase SufC [Acidimicrobiales bacterium]|jgi:Fe-S cluster assembly ATP-binding protein|nr:Fe-S cluster assembly ATPase SufC [Acidimicrobiales bacterium]HJM37914.1 Fe-S cluster assembly ATPase SufC [Acidimicrobiales bacterium]